MRLLSSKAMSKQNLQSCPHSVLWTKRPGDKKALLPSVQFVNSFLTRYIASLTKAKIGLAFPHTEWYRYYLTHWGRVTHICVSKLTIIVSDNGLSPGRRQAIIWTNAVIMLIGPLRTNFSEILIEIFTFSFRKMHLKMSCGKWRPSCLGLNVLNRCNAYFALTHPFVGSVIQFLSVPDQDPGQQKETLHIQCEGSIFFKLIITDT